MIGIGIDTEKDVSLKSFEIIKKCETIFLENYTSKLNVSVAKLETLYGKKIIIANRDLVEKESDRILDSATSHDAAFLVIGDVFSATTHADLFLRAKEKNVEVKVIHNTSILTAVGSTGLDLYKFGKTASLPYFEPNFKPSTPYNIIKNNLDNDCHTLLLLDIKKEVERYMSVNDAILQMLELEDALNEKVFLPETEIVGCARLGSDSENIVYGKVKELEKIDFGNPLHSIIVPSNNLHFVEKQFLELFRL